MNNIALNNKLTYPGIVLEIRKMISPFLHVSSIGAWPLKSEVTRSLGSEKSCYEKMIKFY